LTCVATAFGPPDDDAVRLGHFARIGAHEATGSGEVAGPRDADADGCEKARIALGVREALDAVAHHQSHGAGVEIGPDAFRPEAMFGRKKTFGDAIERFIPVNGDELSRAFGSRP